jgi:hypothetical protein
MTTQEQQLEELKKRVESLEKKSTKFPMELVDRENIKSAVFDGYFQNDQTVPDVNAALPYLKMVWKNKIIYIPFSK